MPNGTVWGCLAQAVWAVRNTDTFADAVIAAIDLGGDTDTVAAVAGGLAGAIHGVQAIPSRWTTYLHGHVTTADGRRTYRTADLQDLTSRLIGRSPFPMAELPPGVGPTEIAPGLFAADLTAAAEVPTDWAVISMCRVGRPVQGAPGPSRGVPHRQGGRRNADSTSAVDDIVATHRRVPRRGRTVVVHCHHGQSRTGLALRAWLMHTNGWDEPTATAHVAEKWPELRLHNRSFTELLRSRS